MIDFSDKVKKLSLIFKNNGYEFYAVGGAVRDIILGKTPDDIDFCTNATPEEMLKMFPHSIKTGIKHGTLTIPFMGDFYEVTTYRIDGKYSDGRHPDNIKYSSNLKEDLSRRDFTINALAKDVESNEIIDLFDGIKDIELKRIKTVGKAELRFSEDALRMLRAIRFEAKLGFSIEQDTMNAIKTNASLIRRVSKERIFTEFAKTVTSKYRNNAFKSLSSSGLWEEIFSCVQNKIITMHGSCFDISCSLASFFILTNTAHDEINTTMLDLKTSNALRRDVMHLSDSYNLFLNKIPKSDYEKRCFASIVQKQYLNAFFDVLLTTGSPYYSLKQEYGKLTEYPLSIKELAINGNDLSVIGYSGEKIKEMLNQALDNVLKNPDNNTKEKLIYFAKKQL